MFEALGALDIVELMKTDISEFEDTLYGAFNYFLRNKVFKTMYEDGIREVNALYCTDADFILVIDGDEDVKKTKEMENYLLVIFQSYINADKVMYVTTSMKTVIAGETIITQPITYWGYSEEDNKKPDELSVKAVNELAKMMVKSVCDIMQEVTSNAGIKYSHNNICPYLLFFVDNAMDNYSPVTGQGEDNDGFYLRLREIIKDIGSTSQMPEMLEDWRHDGIKVSKEIGQKVIELLYNGDGSCNEINLFIAANQECLNVEDMNDTVISEIPCIPILIKKMHDRSCDRDYLIIRLAGQQVIPPEFVYNFMTFAKQFGRILLMGRKFLRVKHSVTDNHFYYRMIGFKVGDNIYDQFG